MANSLSFDNSEYIDMALENSYDMNAVCQQNDSVYRIPPDLWSLPQYCQPYLDHSYAMSMASASSSASAVDVSQVPVMAEPLETLAAYIDIEDVSCNTTVVTAPMDQDASDDSNEGDPWEGSVTRCICDFQHDDGYMICCDRCGVWQHVDCMGVDRNNIPDSYLCELCNPRPIDKRRAIRLQTIKKEQMESEMSATDSSSDERVGGGGGGGRGSGRKRKEPIRRRLDGGPSLTQPNRPPAKRRTTSELGDDKPNGRKNRQLTNIKTPGSRGPRRQSAGESSTRTRRNSAFDAQHHVTIDHSVEDVCQNSYTNGILMLLASVKEREVSAGKVATSTPINPSLLKEQISTPRIRLAHFGPDAKGIAATETIRVNQAVAEYTGRVMMADEYELDNQLNMFMPFVLRYAGAQGVNVCIDSSISGNDARYVRCSCMPNAKVVHVIEQSTIRFFLCATKNIAEGREVTIPFYFDYQKCNSEVLCACHRASCQVARFFKQKSSSRPVRVRRNAAFAVPDAKPRTSASAEALDNGKGAATPSGVRQNNRRSAASSEIRKTTQVMSPDVGSDITLMNALTAISSTTMALGSAPRSSICSTDGQQPNGGHVNSPLATSEASTAAATRSSGVTPIREAAKAERGRKATGVGRNRNQSQPETSLEASVGRVGIVRSNRLRDKAQQQIASLPSQKD